MHYSILIIDDEKDIRHLLARILELEGYDVTTAADGKSALQLLSQHGFQVVIADIKLPDINGIQLTAQIKEAFPATEVICLTAYGNVHDGVQAIKNGAFDYLVKGDDRRKIIPLVSKAVEKSALQFKVKRLQEKIVRQYGFRHIIGQSPAIQEAISMARKAAKTDTTILLTGATGSGKEVFAHAIHAESLRQQEAFVAINCSAIGRDIMESEMFGYKAGAFTGASRDKKGLMEEAHRGTLFLDEIGELNIDLQAKLLRVLETGTFIRPGETKETRVDIRIIAATNRNLEEACSAGNFREDLFYRLSVFQIHLPTLNERKEDIAALASFFTLQFAAKLGKKITGYSAGFRSALEHHLWKGNIRELRNIIERAVILCEQEQLTEELLPFNFSIQQEETIPNVSFQLKHMEKAHIHQVLRHTQGNKTKAAELLGISLTTLYAKIKEYQL